MIKIKCLGCNKKITRNSGSHRYCKKCAKERIKIQSRENARKYSIEKGIIPIGSKINCSTKGCKGRLIKIGARSHLCDFCTRKLIKRDHRNDSRRRRKNKLPEVRKYARTWKRNKNKEIKLQVLSYYGKGGKLLCSWRNCLADDIDFLTIDHINNDGGKERNSGLRGGIALYERLKRNGFPKGFQTLCMNHQWKKEILRRKREVLP